jgi:uncharacterized membrane protein
MERGVTDSESRMGKAAFVACLALYLAITIPLAAVLNLWIDEAYSLETSSKGIAHALEHARDFELQPPFYFLLLTAWRTIDDSYFTARMFSIVCGLATLVVAREIAKRWMPTISPLWIVAPLAVNSILIDAAVEIRLYALVILESAVLILLFHDGFLAERPSRWARAFYTVLAVASLYTFYYLGFLLAAHGASLLVLRRWREVGYFAIGMIVTSVLFIPGVLEITSQVDYFEDRLGGRTSLLRAAVLMGGRVFSLPLSAYHLAQPVRWAVMIGGAVFVVTALAVHRKSVTPRTIAIWTTVAVVAVFHVLTVYFVTGEDHMIPRHSRVLLLPGLMLLLASIELFKERRLLLAAGMAAIVSLSTAALWVEYHSLAKVGDYKRVARFLEANAASDEPVFVSIPDAILPFALHYSGPPPLVPVPGPPNLQRYDIPSWVPESAEQVRNLINERVAPGQRFWFYNDRAPDDAFLAVPLHLDRIEDALSSGYELERDESFYVARLRLFRRE